MPLLLSPFLLPLIALITVTPGPIAIQLGPLPVYWYGICYALGLAATYVMVRARPAAGPDARLVDNGMIFVAIAALIGGRLYHVIDQWPLYKDDLLRIVLPPYTGLGVYGGILDRDRRAVVLIRALERQPILALGGRRRAGPVHDAGDRRAGGTSSTRSCTGHRRLPWGIAIDCAHRVAALPLRDLPDRHDRLSSALPVRVGLRHRWARSLLWLVAPLARGAPGRPVPDLLIWYAPVRLALETLRTGNWTVLGVPTATIVSVLIIVGTLVVLAVRHRPGAADSDRWGDPPEPAVGAALAEVGVSADAPTGSGADEVAGLAVETTDEPTDGGGDRSPGRWSLTTWPLGGSEAALATTGSTPDAVSPSPATLPPDPGRARGGSPGGRPRGPRWLGRTPEAKASLLYRFLRLVARFACSGSFGSGSRRPARSTCPGGGYLLVGAAHRGWMDPFVVMHALPAAAARLVPGQRPVDLHVALARAPDPQSRRPAAGLARRDRRRRHVASARAVVGNGGVFVQMPEGTVCRAAGRIGPFRPGAALIAIRTGAPIVPLVMAGTEELYLGRRMATRVLPPTSARALLGDAWDGTLPAEGSREELELARSSPSASPRCSAPRWRPSSRGPWTRPGIRGGSGSG